MSRLERVREECKVSKTAIALALDLTLNGYVYKEKNETLTAKQLSKVAEALGLDTSELVRRLEVPIYSAGRVSEPADPYGKKHPLASASDPFEFARLLFEHREPLGELLQRIAPKKG